MIQVSGSGHLPGRRLSGQVRTAGYVAVSIASEVIPRTNRSALHPTLDSVLVPPGHRHLSLAVGSRPVAKLA